MNTTASSLSSSLSDHSWLTPHSRRSSSRAPRLAGRRTHYVLASESPLNSDDDRESVLSIQAKETDFVQDTSDTESCGGSGSDTDGAGLEYELASEPDVPDERAGADTSDDTDSEIISTRVISVAVVDVEELEFADSEESDAASDPELGPYDYWSCAQCRSANNNPLYSYCEKCFKARKDFFPPRPKRKSSVKPITSTKTEPISESQATLMSRSIVKCSSWSTDSGVESAFNSQELSRSQESSPSHETVRSLSDLCFEAIRVLKSADGPDGCRRGKPPAEIVSASVSSVQPTKENTDRLVDVNMDTKGRVILDKKNNRKRRAECIERQNKRNKVVKYCSSYSSDSSASETEGGANLGSLKEILHSDEGSSTRTVAKVQPIVKTLSDPFLTFESVVSKCEERRSVSENESGGGRGQRISKKAIMTSLKEKLDSSEESNMCIVCCAEPKSGVFVHGRIAHICCCYRCAVKVWVKARRCPVCNCKVSNVLKAVVM